MTSPIDESWNKREIIEVIQLFQTQNQQIIDILMMILKNASEHDAELVDHIHNQRHQFLSDLSVEELTAIERRIE